jgi:4'-phosphopantetheinyl transferase
LRAGEVHVWATTYDGSWDGALLQEYRNILAAAERIQQRRFHFARDRLRYLLTRAMVRVLLSRYALRRPCEWRFTSNAYGRPSIVGTLGGAKGLTFNVSHTHSLIVAAIAADRDVGIDVENFRDRSAAVEVAERFFARSEVADLRATAGAQQQRRFFEYWTLKEAYIKALAMGLSVPLNGFAFDLSQEARVALHVNANIEDGDPQRWRLWQMEIDASYIVAICAERARGIRLRTIVPLRTATDLPAICLRASHFDANG